MKRSDWAITEDLKWSTFISQYQWWYKVKLMKSIIFCYFYNYLLLIYFGLQTVSNIVIIIAAAGIFV